MARAPRSSLATDGARAAGLVIADSATELDGGARARAVVCGSHGGRFAAALAVRAEVGGIVLNDAAVGKDRAGIAGLELLDEHRIPGATVGYLSARIGDGGDTLQRGVLSHANLAAVRLGCAPGMSAREAVERMAAATRAGGPAAVIAEDAQSESRHLLHRHRPRVWALDSASLATVEDAGDILLTGSHGLLVGGSARTALRVDPLAAVFNDAGRSGAEQGRLAVLDERGIAAATVDAQSARIGDGRSTYFDGVLSAVNRTAASLGVMERMTARGFTELLLATDAESPRPRGAPDWTRPTSGER